MAEETKKNYKILITLARKLLLSEF